MSERQPNILFILNDHQAYYRHGWDGGVRPARPNFERFAAGGVNFERAYTACPLCVPARRTLATALFPHNHGLLTNNQGLPTRDQGIIWPLMSEAGYRCYYYGKVHLGRCTPKDYGCEGFGPEGYGNPYIQPEYHEYLRRRKLPEASFNVAQTLWPGIPLGPGYQITRGGASIHATGTLETPPETHESFFVANLAVEKLRQIAAGGVDKPFFMRVDTWGPHQPYFAARQYVAMYDPKKIAEYGNFRDDLADKPTVHRTVMDPPLARDRKLVVPSYYPWSWWAEMLAFCYAQITMVDAAVGVVLDELERLGLADNTLVIWTTDHGDAVASHGGRFDKCSYLSEEVIRVPMAMRWPGRIPPGQVSDKLVSLVDLPATVTDAGGARWLGPVDGDSLLPLAEGGEAGWRDDLMIQTHGHHRELVVGRAIITDRHKYAFYQYGGSRKEEELYDLQGDPYEMTNRIADPAARDVLADITGRLEAWRTRTGDEGGKKP